MLLSSEQSEKFLARAELKELCALPPAIVESAVRNHRKLRAALVAARAAAQTTENSPGESGERKPTLNLTPRNPLQHRLPVRSRGPNSQTSGYSKSGSTRRSAAKNRAKEPRPKPSPGDIKRREAYRRWGPTGKPPEGGQGLRTPSPSGPSGAAASYHSGLARNPGTPEPAIGNRCEHCGAWMPSGTSHECRS